MKTHKQLTEGQRVQIAALKKAGASNKEIAVRSYALTGHKSLEWTAPLVLKKPFDLGGEHNTSKHSPLQFIDVHWFFIERTQLCQLSSVGRSDEHFA